MRFMTKATKNSTPTIRPTTTVVTISSALSMTSPSDLAVLADKATLVLLPLDCLAVLESSHVGTRTQAARTGRARAPHPGDSPRSRRATGLGRGHHPPARRAHRVQP